MSKDKKSLNLYGDDKERWQKIKLNQIDERDDPDLSDIDVLREMMDLYEDERVKNDEE